MIKSIAILTILILGLSFLFPWWIIVMICFQYILLTKQSSLLKSILISFIAGVISYASFSIIMAWGVNNSPAELIGKLFGELPAWSAYAATGILGGLIAALGGLTGFLGKKVFRRAK